ncbi:hypothetical protein J6590_041911 [Homalodisca vitripennis]|nr:hypothetical protein J6590_041911 [Homalodisca vitripennis]
MGPVRSRIHDVDGSCTEQDTSYSQELTVVIGTDGHKWQLTSELRFVGCLNSQSCKTAFPTSAMMETNLNGCTAYSCEASGFRNNRLGT